MLLETLSDLGHDVAFEFPTINHGGCCVYASIVGDLLLRQGIETSIWVGHLPDYNIHADVAEVRNNVRNPANVADWNDNGVFFNHVGLEVSIDGVKYLVDTDRYDFASDKFKEFHVLAGRLTVTEAALLAADHSAWNPTFPRCAIPEIKRMARRYLRKESCNFGRYR